MIYIFLCNQSIKIPLFNTIFIVIDIICGVFFIYINEIIVCVCVCVDRKINQTVTKMMPICKWGRPMRTKPSHSASPCTPSLPPSFPPPSTLLRGRWQRHHAPPPTAPPAANPNRRRWWRHQRPIQQRASSARSFPSLTLHPPPPHPQKSKKL